MYLTAPPGTKYSLLITESNSWVPQELEGAFFHPLGGFRQITGRFGYHGSAWGNEDLKNYPFYAGPTTDPEKYQDFVHLGNDFKANPGDLVYAIGNGELIQTGDWSGPWGHYLIQTVTHQGQLYTALYGHLEADSILKKQSYKAGDVIAQVCHIPMKEEPDHLHFQLQKGDPINTNDPQGPARTVAGATHFSRWTKGNYMNVEDPRYFRFNK